MNEFIQWPSTEEKNNVSVHFYSVAGFPNVIGCNDDTHVQIQAPKTDRASFVNRKGKFTSFNASLPGSCHDSHVFRTSGLCQRLERDNKSFSDGVLLSDSGPFLMTPFLSTDSDERMRYQQSHTKTRVAIERPFGQFKCRFHVLNSEMRLAPAKICRIITACLVLHNIAHLLHEPEIEEVEENDLDIGNERCVNEIRDGAAVRDFIVHQYEYFA